MLTCIKFTSRRQYIVIFVCVCFLSDFTHKTFHCCLLTQFKCPAMWIYTTTLSVRRNMSIIYFIYKYGMHFWVVTWWTTSVLVMLTKRRKDYSGMITLHKPVPPHLLHHTVRHFTAQQYTSEDAVTHDSCPFSFLSLPEVTGRSHHQYWRVRMLEVCLRKHPELLDAPEQRLMRHTHSFTAQ